MLNVEGVNVHHIRHTNEPPFPELILIPLSGFIFVSGLARYRLQLNRFIDNLGVTTEGYSTMVFSPFLLYRLTALVSITRWM